MRIQDQTLTGRIEIDGHHYVNVRFEDAQLLYFGGKAPVFENCAFKIGCAVSFQKEAANTLMFLRSLANRENSTRIILEGLMPELKD